MFLFHELLSQPAASRACCHFWCFITAVILCSHFPFATCAQPPPPSLFLNPSSTTQAHRNAACSLPCTAFLSLITSTRVQTWGCSFSGWPSSFSCNPCLQKGPKSSNFDCVLKPTCLNACLSASEGPGPQTGSECRALQIHLRRSTNSSFQDQAVPSCFLGG